MKLKFIELVTKAKNVSQTSQKHDTKTKKKNNNLKIVDRYWQDR